MNTQTEPTVIPWQAVQKFANDHGQDYIVMLTWSEKTKEDTVLTWGRSIAQADAAAEMGNTLKEKLGWDSKDCNAISDRVQGLIDLYDQVIYESRKHLDEISALHVKMISPMANAAGQLATAGMLLQTIKIQLGLKTMNVLKAETGDKAESEVANA